MKRGQVALEFLSTYGFTFFMLLITLGVLSYTGIFNFSSLKGNDCFFPQGLECIDFVTNTANPASDPAWPAGNQVNPVPAGNSPYLRVVLYNSFGVNLTVLNATMKADQFNGNTSCAVLNAGAPKWPLATNRTIWCPIPASSYHPTDRWDATIMLTFIQENGNYNHSVQGFTSTVVQ
jgi:hypothetical protein